MARQSESPTRAPLARSLPPGFWKWSPLVGLLALIGGLVGWIAAADAASSHEARVSLATVDVGWSDLSATHEQIAVWFDDIVGADADDVRLVPPVDPQLTAFGIAATAPTAAQAVDLADSRADLLVAEAARQRTAEIESELAVLVEQERTLQGLLDDVVLELDAAVDARTVLIEAGGVQGEIDRLTSDFWLLDTERNRLNGELIGVQQSIRGVENDLASASSVIDRIGPARPIVDEATDRRPFAAAAGALVGLWIGAAGLRWWLMRRARAGTGVETIGGAPVVGSVDGSLDHLALASMVQRARQRSGPTRMIDITKDAGASLVVSSLALDGVDLTRVDSEFELVGASAVLVADASARLRDLEQRIERLIASQIEVDSVVLLGDEDRRALASMASAEAVEHAFA